VQAKDNKTVYTYWKVAPGRQKHALLKTIFFCQWETITTTILQKIFLFVSLMGINCLHSVVVEKQRYCYGAS
jgi:hypothetical protein